MKLLFFDSYLTTIEKSVDADIFQTLWAEIDENKKDLTESGKKSCAIFVSSILKLFNLIDERHATVTGTIKDMENSGWVEIDKPKKGCVLHWEKMKQSKEETEHIGFYIGENQAVSNDWKSGSPQKHHWTYGSENGKPKREVISIYWNTKLENQYF